MADFLSIEEAIASASQAIGCSLTQVPGKKIMYHGRTRSGQSIILCTPQAKLQPQGFYWTDITEVQYRLLNSYDRASIVFRLQGNRLTQADWDSLKRYLTPSCMKNNTSEGNHWKLNIYSDRIKVTGNPTEIPLTTIKKGTIWDRL